MTPVEHYIWIHEVWYEDIGIIVGVVLLYILWLIFIELYSMVLCWLDWIWRR